MKIQHLAREASATFIAALATASVFTLVPILDAQQPTPAASPVFSPAPSGDQPDIFDAIKKGADKLQREARKTRDIEPELHQLIEHQHDLMLQATETKKELESRDKELMRQLDESKRELTTVLTKQQEVLVQLARAVDALDADMKAHHAKKSADAATPSPTPSGAAALPVTEPAPSPTPGGAQP